MKLLLSTTLFFAFFSCVTAQEGTTKDTTIYEVAETLPFPLLKSCMPANRPGWTLDSTRRCSEIQFLSLLSSNMRYPEEAREKNIQGTVVLSFVVEPDNGRISYINLLKDIGGGCGAEAIRVLKVLDTLGLRWAAATRDGQAVRVRHSVPLKFKLQENLPYYLAKSGDTIYTSYTTEPAFKYGIDSLIGYALNQTRYPKAWSDSCKTGVIEMAILITAKGAVSVENVLDFNNLGLDFQWEAMRMANRMSGMWLPAIYEERAVTTTLPLRAVFKSDADGCEVANNKFDQAMILADEGSTLLANQKTDEAIQKWSQALALQPNNCELLYYRGNALLNQNKRTEACDDFNRIKTIMGITWFEEIRRLVCGR